jgi:hypothetical protein
LGAPIFSSQEAHLRKKYMARMDCRLEAGNDPRNYAALADGIASTA